MRYRALGKTTLSVSEVSLGTVQFGMPYGIADPSGQLPELSEKQSIAILHQALAEGVNFLDTARNYGHSEAVIAQALKKRQEEVYLATKLTPLAEALSDKEIQKEILASLEASRKSLKRETLDLIQIHNATEALLERSVIIETLMTAQQREWIRFKGVSTYGPQAPVVAIAQGHWDTVQVEFNILNQACIDVLEAASKNNIGVIVRSAMLKGALSTAESDLPQALKPLRQKVLALPKFFNRPELSVPQACLLFVLSHSQVSTMLTGVVSTQQLQENLLISSASSFSPEQLEEAKSFHISDAKLIDPREWNS